MSDLIERLADHRAECPVEGCQRCAAYDEIERLAAELEQVYAAAQQFEDSHNRLRADNERLQARVEALEGELRASRCLRSHELADWCECGWSRAATEQEGE